MLLISTHMSSHLPDVAVAPPMKSRTATWTVLYLSHQDQLFNYYNKIALFYAPRATNSHTRDINVTHILKSALEKLLVDYPWVAGRLRLDDTQKRLEIFYNVDSGDDVDISSSSIGISQYGVQFICASAVLTFSQLGDVTTPSPSLDVLYPRRPDLTLDLVERPLLAIQVTTFLCGGFTLSLLSNHVLFDAYGAAVFLQNLCSVARGDGLRIPPDNVDRALRFKPRDPPSPSFEHPQITKERESSKGHATAVPFGTAIKYSFSKRTLENLRLLVLKDSSAGTVTSCSRFCALAAFLWVARAKSIQGWEQSQKLPLRIPVNVREKIVASIPRSYMGNAVFYAEPTATVKDLRENSLGFAALKVQDAIKGVTAEYVQSEIDLIEAFGGTAQLETAELSMPSLAGLGFYDTDCGWGKPVYCGRPCKQFSNRLIILDGDADRQSLNVLAVFKSAQERTLFEAAIAENLFTRG